LTRAKAKYLEEFFGGFTGATSSLLMLDYDGTLAPLRLDRFRARPWAGVRELLTLIQIEKRSRVVLVTGRPASEVVSLLGVKPVPEVWGLHGSERLHSDGRRELEQVAPAIRSGFDSLGAQLKRDAFGGLLEVKPNAIAMHWRGVSPGRARMIKERTRALFAPMAQMDGVTLLEFEAGLELRAGRNKGDVVTALLEETNYGESCPAAYLGDDITDEAAFKAIEGRGLGVLVRRERRDSAASIWLRPPGELREFLSRWLEACRVPLRD